MTAPIGSRRNRSRQRRLKTSGMKDEGATGAREERRRGERASVTRVLVEIGARHLRNGKQTGTSWKIKAGV